MWLIYSNGKFYHKENENNESSNVCGSGRFSACDRAPTAGFLHPDLFV